LVCDHVRGKFSKSLLISGEVCNREFGFVEGFVLEIIKECVFLLYISHC
jgi:hypothetical protein